MTPRPQPRKPDALDLAETIERAAVDLKHFAMHGAETARAICESLVRRLDQYERTGEMEPWS